MRRIFPLFIIILTITNCATWAPVGGEFQHPKHGFKADLPEGWLKLNPSAHRGKDPLFMGLRVTRNGPLLQTINIGRMSLDSEFVSTKRKLTREMLPQEAADVVADNLRMTEGFLDFEVLENRPAEVGGEPGFRLLCDVRLENRMWKRIALYGTIVEDWFYFLHYYAPRRYYFEQDLETFERVVASFRPAPGVKTAGQ